MAEFLSERGLSVLENDFVRPGLQAPLDDGTVVEYRTAVPVTIVRGNSKRTVMSAATDVGALLEGQGLWLGDHDQVYPSLSEPIAPNQTVRIVRVAAWTKIVQQKIALKIIHRIDLSLPPGSTKIISSGIHGLRETMVRYTTRDNGFPQKTVIATRIVRNARARIIARGVGEWASFANIARRGLEKTSYIAASALTMVATAYTAGCSGCSGTTALGYHAGQGVVAVDPRVIPLGTRLYIPGYGIAIAGDTGGAIVGHRIDLGFNSLSNALQFGRRAIRVYRLH